MTGEVALVSSEPKAWLWGELCWLVFSCARKYLLEEIEFHGPLWISVSTVAFSPISIAAQLRGTTAAGKSNRSALVTSQAVVIW